MYQCSNYCRCISLECLFNEIKIKECTNICSELFDEISRTLTMYNVYYAVIVKKNAPYLIQIYCKMNTSIIYIFITTTSPRFELQWFPSLWYKMHFTSVSVSEKLPVTWKEWVMMVMMTMIEVLVVMMMVTTTTVFMTLLFLLFINASTNYIYLVPPTTMAGIRLFLYRPLVIFILIIVETSQSERYKQRSVRYQGMTGFLGENRSRFLLFLLR